MKFSWKAIALAPLAIPIVYSATFTILVAGKEPLFGFFLFFALGCFVSYSTSVFLLLPSLYLVSKFTPLTARLTACLGIALGTAAYLPILWQSYLASGDDSGPPQESFIQYFQRNFFGIELWAFIVGGFVTTLLYWLIASRSTQKNKRPAT
jgi:hypothetical protein